MSAPGKDSANNKEASINALMQAYKTFEKLAPYKPIDQHVVYKNEIDFHPDKTLFIFHYSWINAIWQKSRPKR